MEVNQSAIFATRPWKIFGEGPASKGAALSAQGFNEGKGKPFTAEDVRYTQSKDGLTLHVIVLGWPEKTLTLRSLGTDAKLLGRAIANVELLGGAEPVRWGLEASALVIQAPSAARTSANRLAAVYRLTLKDDSMTR